MAKQVMISGARGDLGSYLSRGFRDRGDEVFTFGHDHPHRLDLFIHCAAKLKNVDGGELVEGNIDFLRNALDLAKETRCGAFIFLSSLSLYESGHEVISEDTPLSCADPYSCTKLLGEHLVKDANLPSLAIRIPAILERKVKPTNFVSRIYGSLEKGEPVTIYETNREFNSFISMNDLFGFLVNLPPLKGFDFINLASPLEFTLGGLVRLIHQLTGSTSITEVRELRDGVNSQIDITKARSKFRYQPGEVADSLRQWHEERKSRSLFLQNHVDAHNRRHDQFTSRRS